MELNGKALKDMIREYDSTYKNYDVQEKKIIDSMIAINHKENEFNEILFDFFGKMYQKRIKKTSGFFGWILRWIRPSAFALAYENANQVIKNNSEINNEDKKKFIERIIELSKKMGNQNSILKYNNFQSLTQTKNELKIINDSIANATMETDKFIEKDKNEQKLKNRSTTIRNEIAEIVTETNDKNEWEQESEEQESKSELEMRYISQLETLQQSLLGIKKHYNDKDLPDQKEKFSKNSSVVSDYFKFMGKIDKNDQIYKDLKEIVSKLPDVTTQINIDNFSVNMFKNIDKICELIDNIVNNGKKKYPKMTEGI